ncbi:porin, OprB family [Rhodoblastus acidophilus]|uniref:Porin, OprB family n=1 Tax=Rhodoblastus acidophilus TaxID=1074 RepID=A0A212SFF8_RHOAC|nr:carbohydrate porin [Rhodoblastus acidophilus]RAI16450.1 carbohydrate porin [Rhodoblastus acidophilus]SNB84449.1 porin, OprB family [Rhodoblastus acidophilus]
MATLFASRRRVGGRLTTFRSFAGHSRQSATGANPPGFNATRRNWFVRTSLLALLAAGPAFAANEAKPTETAATPDLPSILTSIPTLAPVVDFKKQLMDQGVVLQLNYIGEALGNPSGGVRRGAVYDGRVELAIDADMEKLAHWKGGMIHANGYWIQGTGLSRYYIGNILTASNIEAPPTVRLYELWFEQKALDDRLGLRVGQLAADTEFFVSKYGALFINGTFGWPAFTGANLPSGGPGYPFATPGVRVRLGNDSDPFNILAAVFNGDPAGSCVDDPQRCNRYGTNFRLQDAPLAMQEVQYRYNQGRDDDGLSGSIKLGAFEHYGNFANLRYDTAGVALGSLSSNGVPGVLKGDWGLYGVWDQQIWKDAGRGAALFLRVAGAPQDRNTVNFYIDGGLTFTGLVTGRPDDAFGIGFAHARISDHARGYDIDSGATVVRRAETALELTYQAQIVPGWSVQPDLQYIFGPGGGVSDVNGARVRDAAVLGLRSTINF